ncbi:MAG: NUDIX pyrophosphatase [Candidatus Nitrosocaldus sp.]|nr:NUDIX pyrophosphatase [Candidatus Nitrosocaldus sp.]MDW7999587.1 NUDIX pyrophosphatase [Candidatus Nitrosocaldus sp.]
MGMKRVVHVVTSFVMHDGRILILRRSGMVRTMRHKWAGVSGYIEEGEDALERAYREIEEETGISRRDLRLVSTGREVEVVDEANDTVWIVHPYLFESSSDRVRLDWEHDSYLWIRPEELPCFDTVPMLREALESCLYSAC